MGSKRMLLVVDADREFAERLVAEAATQGMVTTVAANPAVAKETIARTPPSVALLDFSDPATLKESLELLAELNGRTPPVPTLVMTTRDTFAERVEVARQGGGGFLHKSLPIEQIIEAAAHTLQHVYTVESTVLAVDDDPQILAILQALLEPEGIRLTVLEDPQQFWDTLQQVVPDLLILDIDMPYINGVDLCRVVRGDKQWTGLPVVVLTGYTDLQLVRQVFAAGADDFVSKPIVGPELITRIIGRLERARLLRSMAEIDPLTGLTNRHKSVERLRQLLQLADRQRQPFSLTVLDVDYFKQVNDSYGHAVGDIVLRHLGGLLRRSFRNEDVIARWGGEEFVVGMYGSTREQSVRRLTRVLETFRQEVFLGSGTKEFQVTFSAGVAAYPVDGADLQTLYNTADSALYQAKASGRNRVLAHFDISA